MGAGFLDHPLPWTVLVWLPLFLGSNVGFVGLAIWIFINLLLQSTTGQSIGKMVFGIQLVHITEVGERKEEFCQIPTFGRCFWRMVAHLVDTALMFYGWFRPFNHVRYQTYADSMAKTIVISYGTAELMGTRYLTQTPQTPGGGSPKWWTQ